MRARAVWKCALLIAGVLASSTPAQAGPEGRYQAVPIDPGSGYGAEKVLILDTITGHLWIWVESAAVETDSGGRFLIYQTRARCSRVARWAKSWISRSGRRRRHPHPGRNSTACVARAGTRGPLLDKLANSPAAARRRPGPPLVARPRLRSNRHSDDFEDDAMPKLTVAERDAFLATPGMIMNIATVARDGAPLVTPIWFIYEEGRVWFTPRQHSEWLQHIRGDARVALSIDEPVIPYRKVVVRGRAHLDYEVGSDDLWRDRYRRIAQRYIPLTDANAYVDGTDDQPRALCSLRLADSEVRSWRMPIGNEAYDGIWAKRYWTTNAKVKQTPPSVFDQSV